MSDAGDAGARARPSARFVVYGLVTLVAVLLSYVALDDITTDNATSLTAEYTLLTLSAVWCLGVASRLMRGQHFVPGLVSALAVVAAVWGHRAIGPGTSPSWEPEYVATVAALGWFFLLSIYLMTTGWRSLTRSETSPRPGV